jgi:hypothetical protein
MFKELRLRASDAQKLRQHWRILRCREIHDDILRPDALYICKIQFADRQATT